LSTRTVAAGAAAFTVPASVIIGAGLITQAIIGLQASRDHRALADQPHPTATVTRPATAGPTPSASPTQRPQPTDSLVAERPAAGVRAGSQPSTGRAAGGSGMASEQTPPSRTITPASSCSGRIVSVRLALGVLPTCAVTVGGPR
jgi:hypothetical protein